jgi:histidinol dehydrogenase
VSPVTLAAAAVAGVDEVYAVGGAQAIAAMAYGTESIRPVDVIAGPGNVYVAIAKREVAGTSACRGLRRAVEVVVVADAPPRPSSPPST